MMLTQPSTPARKGRKPTGATISVKVELGNKAKKDGSFPLFLRLTQNRKLKRIYIGFDIPAKDWNPNKQEVRRSNPFHTQINQAIESRKAEAFTLKSETKELSTSQMVENLKGKVSDSFFEYADGLLSKMPYNTAKNNRSVFNKLRDFLKGQDLLFSQINVQLLRDFEDYLKQIGNNQTTVSMAFNKVRAVVNYAVEVGKLERKENPFLGFKIKEGKPERIRLTEDELEAFRTVVLPEGSLIWHTRNYWLFAYYGAGIRFSDVATLQRKNIQNSRLSYVMRKTKNKVSQSHSIQLPRQAEEILALYPIGQGRPEDYIFPILNTQRVFDTEDDLLKEISRKNALINKYLKQICFKANIPKDVSFHSARHTFADLGRRKVKDVYAISKLLRHSKISMTEKYLSEFDTETTDKAMADIFD
jgi:integrase/recombinase XerD